MERITRKQYLDRRKDIEDKIIRMEDKYRRYYEANNTLLVEIYKALKEIASEIDKLKLELHELQRNYFESCVVRMNELDEIDVFGEMFYGISVKDSFGEIAALLQYLFNEVKQNKVNK